MLNRKHNLKSGKSKDKKKGFETEKQDRKPKERKNISGKKLQLNILMFFFSWNKSNEERKGKKETKTRNKKKAKKKDKKEGKKKRTTERTEKEKQKKGEAKKG